MEAHGGQAGCRLRAERARTCHALPQVGKHLGLVNALPLRTVCREWRDTLTLTAVEAEIDLEPDAAEDAAALARRQLFLKRCPRLRKLTCHVSPGVSLAKVTAAAQPREQQRRRRRRAARQLSGERAAAAPACAVAATQQPHDHSQLTLPPPRAPDACCRCCRLASLSATWASSLAA